MSDLKLAIVLFCFAENITAQNIETRLNNGELKMNFPGIYFMHNSTSYALMPYTVDSCFKHIASHIEDTNTLVLWRDSLESETLTRSRIKKLRNGLSQYIPVGRIHIQSMGQKQKISRRTVRLSTSSEQTAFLLSLNSVFEVSSARQPATVKNKKICLYCMIRLKPCQINRRFFIKLGGN